MAFLNREFIAVPDTHKNQILYKWPDVSIRRWSRVIVEPDMRALFVSKGQVVADIPPGNFQVDATEIPGLGILLDAATGGKAYRAELYFVGTREYTQNPFGGRVDDVQDPQTGLIVTMRVFGEYSLRVIDTTKLVLNLVGTQNVSNNEEITNWVATQLLKVMRPTVTSRLVNGSWSILGLSTHTAELEPAFVEACNAEIFNYGLALVRMGNFDINLSEEDEAKLKKIANDTAYSRLAGSFQQYAAGEALLGAGEGMAQGGGGANGALFAAGLGMGGGMGGAVNGAQPGPTPPPAPGFTGAGPGYAAQGAGAGAGAQGVECANCHAQNSPTAKFCAECGTAMATKKHCTNCGAELAPGAKFCAECGTSTAAPAAPAADNPTPPEGTPGVGQ